MCSDEVPERPTRVESDEPDCLEYVNGGFSRWLFSLFGILLFGGGILCLVTVCGGLRTDDSPLGVGAIVSLLSLGIVHAGVGGSILWYAFGTAEWVRIDRCQNSVSKQTGVLCFRRFANGSICDFSEVSIFPVHYKWQRREDFDVALTGPNDKRFPLGRVTLSYDLAREFAQEVGTFLSLPVR